MSATTCTARISRKHKNYSRTLSLDGQILKCKELFSSTVKQCAACISINYTLTSTSIGWTTSSYNYGISQSRTCHIKWRINKINTTRYIQHSGRSVVYSKIIDCIL